MLLPITADAAALNIAPLPDGVGINIHFVQGGERDLDLIAAAGVRVVRNDFKWVDTERYLGVYDFSAYDELAQNLAQRGLRPLFILDYSNPLYEETVPRDWHKGWPFTEVISPSQPRSVVAFAAWAAAAAAHFQKYGVIWEIWNEPNIHFWKPAPDVAAYSRLANATCDAVRAVNADATVIGPASAGLPWDFLDAFFASGILSCLDAVSVHPYRQTVPETAGADYMRLRTLIDRYAPPERRGRLPIVSGEWGYDTVYGRRTQQQQAEYLVRTQLFNLLSGVPLSVWYDWKNDGLDGSNHEHNFGIVQADLEPKIAYVALRTMAAELSGYQLVRRLDLGNADDYALLFANAAGQAKVALWTAGVAHDVRLAAPPPPYPTQMTRTDQFGLRDAVALDGAWIPLHITSTPFYLSQ